MGVPPKGSHCTFLMLKYCMRAASGLGTVSKHGQSSPQEFPGSLCIPHDALMSGLCKTLWCIHYDNCGVYTVIYIYNIRIDLICSAITQYVLFMLKTNINLRKSSQESQASIMMMNISMIYSQLKINLLYKAVCCHLGKKCSSSIGLWPCTGWDKLLKSRP